MSWYKKLAMFVVVVLLSPFILICILIAGFAYLFQYPKNLKLYKKSPYYKDFNLKFKADRFHSPEYRFYNSMRKRNLQIDYIRQESNGLEYFVYGDTLFLFPDFEQIAFNEEKSIWEVDYDGDWESFAQAYQKILAKLDGRTTNGPVKLLVERRMFCATDLNGVEIPECIFLTWSYETAFENEDSPLKLRVPTNTKELYEMMRETNDLCGDFEITENGSIHWDLYDHIQIDISVDSGDCYIGVHKKLFGKIQSGIAHWHPTIYEIYGEVCKIGVRGNVLVIRTFLTASGVLYIGDEKECPYSPDQKVLFGKIYYLKAT